MEKRISSERKKVLSTTALEKTSLRGENILLTLFTNKRVPGKYDRVLKASLGIAMTKNHFRLRLT